MRAARSLSQGTWANEAPPTDGAAKAEGGYVFAVPAVSLCTAAPAMTTGQEGVRLDRETRPIWDRDRRKLSFGPHLVKHFKVPAPNQELILQSFEEESWPMRLDDPLPYHAAIDPKRRLHDTINSLNRNQRVPLLRFLGDGNGQAILWEHIERERLSQ